METLSQRFLEALAPPRDRLYTLALARAGTAPAAESALLQAIRATFGRAATDEFLDIPRAVEQSLTPSAPAAPPVDSLAAAPPVAPVPAPVEGATAPAASAPGESASAVAAEVETPMPADVWARLSATVQLEAARSAGALRPDSELLQPDPMLAPRKPRMRAPKPEFDAGSFKRFMALIGLALLTGVGITIYILTRPPAALSKPVSPSSAPATVPTRAAAPIAP